MRKVLLRSIHVALALFLLCFAELALSQTAVPLARLDADEYSKVKDKKGVVILAVNWNRRWKCGQYENAQLRSFGFDRMPVTKSTDDAPRIFSWMMHRCYLRAPDLMTMHLL